MPIIIFIPVNRAKGGVELTPRRILLLKSINRAFEETAEAIDILDNDVNIGKG